MRKNDGRAIPTFINQAIEGKEISVFGEGSQTRSFCFISDMVEGIYKLAQSDYHLPVNIGNPNEMSILELAEKIKEFIKSKSKIIFHDLPIDDPVVRQPDISKARKILDWEPRMKFGEGIKNTIKWFKDKNNLFS